MNICEQYIIFASILVITIQVVLFAIIIIVMEVWFIKEKSAMVITLKILVLFFSLQPNNIAIA